MLFEINRSEEEEEESIIGFFSPFGRLATFHTRDFFIHLIRSHMLSPFKDVLFFFKRLVKHKSYPHKRFVLYTYKIMYYICMYIRLTEHVVNGAFGYYKMCVFKSDRTPSIFKNDCIVVILYVLQSKINCRVLKIYRQIQPSVISDCTFLKKVKVKYLLEILAKNSVSIYYDENIFKTHQLIEYTKIQMALIQSKYACEPAVDYIINIILYPF